MAPSLYVVQQQDRYIWTDDACVHSTYRNHITGQEKTLSFGGGRDEVGNGGMHGPKRPSSHIKSRLLGSSAPRLKHKSSCVRHMNRVGSNYVHQRLGAGHDVAYVRILNGTEGLSSVDHPSPVLFCNGQSEHLHPVTSDP